MEDFPSSLYHLLSEVGILGLRYVEAHDKELIDTQAELDNIRELYNKVKEENEIINEQQEVLIECLAMMETKVEKCRAKLSTKKEKYIIA
ncbi:hypothetical protein PVK06_012268 [Gossypium arboreum]|uniref:Uncharacterized protein n=1 Tax=Gossypium arboreum TaxID=29729 RepID=A0ABR0QBQ3_GOSAR|nr:hypothetical protein PVK06_012268 [Gossypium arboreum]